VTGECDINRFYGTLTELKAFIGITEPTDTEKLNIMWREANEHPPAGWDLTP
jgi:hypothetical protein